MISMRRQLDLRCLTENRLEFAEKDEQIFFEQTMRCGPELEKMGVRLSLKVGIFCHYATMTRSVASSNFILCWGDDLSDVLNQFFSGWKGRFTTNEAFSGTSRPSIEFRKSDAFLADYDLTLHENDSDPEEEEVEPPCISEPDLWEEPGPVESNFSSRYSSLGTEESVPDVGEAQSVRWNLFKDVLFEFIQIPAGSFLMGSTSPAGEPDAKPAHPVDISRPFLIGKHTVTKAQYKVVMKSRHQSSNLPITNVSRENAIEFCKKLTAVAQKEELLSVRREVVLPSEAEWEYACRAGSSGDYAGDVGDMGWFAPPITGSHEVGQKQPNGWGVYDMHGNVWEMCQDFYGAYPATRQKDPIRTASCREYHVLRGGCSGLPSSASTSSYRFPCGTSENNIGFRVVIVERG